MGENTHELQVNAQNISTTFASLNYSNITSLPPIILLFAMDIGLSNYPQFCSCNATPVIAVICSPFTKLCITTELCWY